MRSRLQQFVLSRLPESTVRWLKKRHYLRLLKKQGPDEEKDFAVIARLVQPGDHVIDIGANYGVYTKFLSDLVGDSGVVHSVEPVPSTFEIIAWNVARLKLRNVRLLNYAFSDHDAEAVMEIPRLPTGGENYYMAKIVTGRADRALRRVTIKAVTLDSQFASIEGPLTFIKCDVEGHELRCISGAMRTLRAWRPAWCVEVSGDLDEHGSDAWTLIKLLETESYQVFWFDGEVLRRRRSGDRSVNYFFLQPHHLPAVSPLERR